MNNFFFKPNENKKGYNITIFVDNPDSWIVPWAKKIQDIISPFHQTFLCWDKKDIQTGDMNFLLGCTRILSGKYLKKNRLNLVVHESNLPKGRGWSPVAWQVLEGANNIPVVLFDAQEELDEGPIYLQDTIKLTGTELLPEIRAKQGIKTVEIVLNFLKKWPDLEPIDQKGEATYYTKRSLVDDRLDVNKSIAQNFNNLRIVDNELYPAWFEYQGKKYTIKIYQQE